MPKNQPPSWLDLLAQLLAVCSQLLTLLTSPAARKWLLTMAPYIVAGAALLVAMVALIVVAVVVVHLA